MSGDGRDPRRRVPLPLGRAVRIVRPRGHDRRACTVALDRLGVACLTLCPRCAGSDVVPSVSVGTAVRLTLQHCLHLGITADDIAQAMREER